MKTSNGYWEMLHVLRKSKAEKARAKAEESIDVWTLDRVAMWASLATAAVLLVLMILLWAIL